jgi:hypothetical protein
MCRICLFAEDSGHVNFIQALVRRISRQNQVKASLTLINDPHGRGSTLSELKSFIHRLDLGREAIPDLILVVVDSNCFGFSNVEGAIIKIVGKYRDRTICAVPDPHVERWMLIDSRAFKNTYGVGCSAPDEKCDKDRYKELLRAALHQADIYRPLVLMTSDDVQSYVKVLNLRTAAQFDSALGKLIQSLQLFFSSWRKRHKK